MYCRAHDNIACLAVDEKKREKTKNRYTANDGTRAHASTRRLVGGQNSDKNSARDVYVFIKTHTHTHCA